MSDISKKHALSILGTGVYLPPARPVREIVAEAGSADTSIYQGWENVCHALEGDHPSTMGATALQAALQDAGVDPKELKLLIFAGMSRDYLPSWSVSSELMKSCDASGACAGIDLTVGCMGALTALDLAQGWLALRGGGVAAVVTAERWSYTVDHSASESYGLWAHADGAAATVVAMNTDNQAKALFYGAEFVSQSDLNGAVLVEYGGTRKPIAPEGVTPFERKFIGVEGVDMRQRYSEGYQGSYQALKDRFGVIPERVLCNQTANLFMHLIASVIEIPIENFVITGHDTGHVGSADIIIGLDTLLKSTGCHEPYLMAGSTPYAFGSGLLMPA
jgi:3-oxoacyl-[acyl-carrier-protein] synthase III